MKLTFCTMNAMQQAALWASKILKPCHRNVIFFAAADDERTGFRFKFKRGNFVSSSLMMMCSVGCGALIVEKFECVLGIAEPKNPTKGSKERPNSPSSQRQRKSKEPILVFYTVGERILVGKQCLQLD